MDELFPSNQKFWYYQYISLDILNEELAKIPGMMSAIGLGNSPGYPYLSDFKHLDKFDPARYPPGFFRSLLCEVAKLLGDWEYITRCEPCIRSKDEKYRMGIHYAPYQKQDRLEGTPTIMSTLSITLSDDSYMPPEIIKQVHAAVIEVFTTYMWDMNIDLRMIYRY